MEDEEGELFDNTYLDELKRGSLTGRESLTFEEIQRRNSMVPPHLRSSYMPQFADNEPKVSHFCITIIYYNTRISFCRCQSNGQWQHLCSDK